MDHRERHERASALFQEALEVPEEEREAWLEARAGSEPELVAEVRSLLRAHGREEGLLDRPPPVPQAPHEDILPRLRRALEGRYRIESELGSGATSRVFLAWETKHDRKVVLKVLNPDVAALFGPERFEREVRLAAQLSHPHIVGLIDSGNAEGLLYYVMPYVEGETLAELLERRGRLPVAQALVLLRDIAEALVAAHEIGVIHRDLKPANVLCAGSHAYLMDFGVAKALRGGTDPDLTRVGGAVGTPRYMAPEQARGLESVDHRADLWSWGLLAVKMLLGEQPAAGGDPERPFAFGVARRLREACPELPGDVAEVVALCLRPDAEERPGTAQTLTLVLDGAGLDTGGGWTPVRPARGPGWGPWLAVAVLAALFMVAPWVMDTAPGAGLSQPVAVAPFRNETGSPAHDALGRLAGDWLTQGLQGLPGVSVTPWPTALQAGQAAWAGAGAADGNPLATFADASGAGTVITGSLYEVAGRLRLQAVITDVDVGKVVAAPDPVTVPADSGAAGVQALRERVLGSISVAMDERLSVLPGMVERPPTFEAYRIFDRGMDLYLEQEYDRATPEFLDAYASDTTFAVALLYAATTWMNRGRPDQADSLLQVLEGRRDRLSVFDDLRWRYLTAKLRGNTEEALLATREASRMAPGSRTVYNLALTAMEAHRPAEAREALLTLDPDAGPIRQWAPYWSQLAHANHMLGNFEEELWAARERRKRHPDRRVGLSLEVRALAAMGRLEEIRQVLDDAATLPPDTYWSQGAAMVIAAEELKAHDHPGAPEMIRRADAWLRARIESGSGLSAHRYWLASAAYAAGRYREARDIFVELAEGSTSLTYRGMGALSMAHLGAIDEARAFLGDPPRYEVGEHTQYRARLEALAGEIDEAVALLSLSYQQGHGALHWSHATGAPEFRILASDPRGGRLLAPQG